MSEDLGNTWVVGWERARQIPDSGEVTTEHTDKPTGRYITYIILAMYILSDKNIIVTISG